MSQDYYSNYQPKIDVKKRKKHSVYFHIFLFLATFLTTTIAGVQWAGHDFTHLENISYGLTYGLLMMLFFMSHEFGHYFAARYHKVDATLPYFIPFPPAPGMVGLFGTFGAVIRTRSPIMSRKALFDIGVAGPIGGFIMSLILLIYGLMTLPPIDFIFDIHPNYLVFNGGEIPHHGLFYGYTILYSILTNFFANPEGFLPPMNEIYHYPFLNVGWFGLFVTTLNMMPIGQLDGGHITYAMFGKKIQGIIARIFWWLIMAMGGLGFLSIIHDFLSFEQEDSSYYFLKQIFFGPLHWVEVNAPILFDAWSGWLFWGIITKLFIKLDHPPVGDDENLSQNRMLVGWISIIILLLSFSYNGIYFVE